MNKGLIFMALALFSAANMPVGAVESFEGKRKAGISLTTQEKKLLRDFSIQEGQKQYYYEQKIDDITHLLQLLKKMIGGMHKTDSKPVNDVFPPTYFEKDTLGDVRRSDAVNPVKPINYSAMKPEDVVALANFEDDTEEDRDLRQAVRTAWNKLNAAQREKSLAKAFFNAGMLDTEESGLAASCVLTKTIMNIDSGGETAKPLTVLDMMGSSHVINHVVISSIFNYLDIELAARTLR